MSSGKCRPFCLGLNVLRSQPDLPGANESISPYSDTKQSLERGNPIDCYAVPSLVAGWLQGCPWGMTCISKSHNALQISHNAPFCNRNVHQADINNLWLPCINRTWECFLDSYNCWEFPLVCKGISIAPDSPLAGISLGMHPANERRRYNVTMSLIGWVHT